VEFFGGRTGRSLCSRWEGAGLYTVSMKGWERERLMFEMIMIEGFSAQWLICHCKNEDSRGLGERPTRPVREVSSHC